MPSVVSPAQVQTGNQQNMYVPIDGNTVVFPGGSSDNNPSILETPSVNGSNINGLGAPFLISTSVIINGNYPAGFQVDGPTYINYNLNPSNPYVPTLDVSGSTIITGKILASTLLTAQDIFSVPIGFHDFQGAYNLNTTYCMDFGSSRWVWGELFSLPSFTVLNLNAIPANTFSNLPQQNTTGLFSNNIQNIVAMGAVTNYIPAIPSNPINFYHGIETIPTSNAYPRGNIYVNTGDSGYNYCFLAIGPIKSA